MAKTGRAKQQIYEMEFEMFHCLEANIYELSKSTTYD